MLCNDVLSMECFSSQQADGVFDPRGIRQGPIDL